MTVTFEPFPGDGPYGLDRPQFGLAGSPEMNRLYRHCPIMHQRPVEGIAQGSFPNPGAGECYAAWRARLS